MNQTRVWKYFCRQGFAFSHPRRLLLLYLVINTQGIHWFRIYLPRSAPINSKCSLSIILIYNQTPPAFHPVAGSLVDEICRITFKCTQLLQGVLTFLLNLSPFSVRSAHYCYWTFPLPLQTLSLGGSRPLPARTLCGAANWHGCIDDMEPISLHQRLSLLHEDSIGSGFSRA